MNVSTQKQSWTAREADINNPAMKLKPLMFCDLNHKYDKEWLTLAAVKP